MTGVLNAVMSMGGLSCSVTIGNFTTQYGYSQGSYGAISPSSYMGATIVDVHHDTSGNNFSVTLSGVRAQTFIKRVVIQTTAGTIVTLDTSVANYSNDGTNTFWSWLSIGSVWTATTPSPRLIRIF